MPTWRGLLVVDLDGIPRLPANLVAKVVSRSLGSETDPFLSRRRFLYKEHNLSLK